MAAELPAIPRAEFEARLRPFGVEPDSPAAAGLFGHYETLRRWNRAHALVGPVERERVVERHYGDALRALDRIPHRARLLDVGSGAGFPGLVLAIARPDLEVTLVEPRHKKAAFLRAAARAAGARVSVLVERVESPLSPALPERIDCITLRALKLESDDWTALLRRLAPNGRILLWAGRRDPELPAGLRVEEQSAASTGTGFLLVLVPRRNHDAAAPDSPSS